MGERDTIPLWMTGLVLVWGTAFTSIRALTPYLTPAQLTWGRYVPFLVIFGAWLLWRRREKMASLEARDWARYVLLGVLGVFGYHFPLYYGMRDDAWGPGATAAMAGVLVATTPLWTLLFGLMRREETLDGRRAIGSLVAFAGVLVVILLGRGAVELGLAKKAALVLLAPVFWSWYNILGKPLANRDGGRFFTGMTMCLGTLLLAPYGLWIGLDPVRDFTPALWGWLAYVSLAATVAGYAIWNHALQYRSPAALTSWIYVIPVVAAATGWLFLGERVTWWLALGAILVIVGVWQVNRKPRVVAAPS